MIGRNPVFTVKPAALTASVRFYDPCG